ncbi:MAG TPA: GntR family transcriptional regulator [Solirubrobacterales bacterium]|nr:GntR family transcriptional regulator [Solirubrobacterales bacterium]
MSSEAVGTLRRHPVVRAPLGEQIADAVRAEILLGILKPGEHLSQRQICERFGTSRIPVRDALASLLHEGFVTEGVGHRVVVARFTRQDLSDIYMIEGLLHGVAVRRAAARITASEVEELREIHDQFKQAVADNRTDEIATLNWEFHRRLNQIAASPRLVAALRPLSGGIPKDIISMLPKWGSKAASTQKRLLKSLQDSDGERAEAIVVKYTKEAGADLIEFLESRGVDFRD